MNLVGITINHRTAPIELREALHLSKNEIVDLIPKLKETLFNEGFIISTCNRTEIYGIPKVSKLHYQHIIDFLLENKNISGLKPEHFEKYFSCGAVKHLFKVSTGIDSLVVGDSQILGQVKEAFEISEDMNFSGSVLRRVFDVAVKVGKRAIRETEIGEGAVTVSYAAVQVVEKIFASLDKKKALVIGAGETGELAAIHLKDRGVGEIAIANRTLSRAEKLAEKIHGEIIPFSQLKDHLHHFDIIISATSSNELIITKDDIKQMMKRRKGLPVVIMDIAIPRDIDPGSQEIDNVFYHDIDSLEVIVKQNMKKREKEIPKVESIVMEELVSFFSWYNTLEVVPTIKRVREFFEDIRKDELEKIKHKVTDDDYAKLEDMTRRMIGRLLHNPTIKLREIAEQGTNIQEVETHSVILKELFGLNNGHSKIYKPEESDIPKKEESKVE
ncbi:MAG: glutamyl-tRNA reductase [Melioribacteraceae bacterium]|nr:glutamyl-tRNA reductase [Ignavibacteriota bacterium]MBZ0182556.1 glutamyl-tRNA reductase [Melioribacteraceae bacterium]